MALTRTDLQQLAEERLGDAELLLQFDRASAAYYMGGYAVECALKACIAKNVQAFEFPDRDTVNKSWTHKLDQLLRVASLDGQLRADAAGNAPLEAAWNLVSKWTPDSRYERTSRQHAQDFFTASSTLVTE